MDFRELYLPDKPLTGMEERLFIACVNRAEEEIQRIAKEALKANHPLSVDLIQRVAEREYDTAWPLYAIALRSLAQTSKETSPIAALSKLPEMDAVETLYSNAYDLTRIWQSEAPLRLYRQIMQLVDIYERALHQSKGELIQAAKISEQRRFLAVHLQLIPELQQFVDISTSLEAMIKGSRSNRALIISNLTHALRTHPNLSLAPISNDHKGPRTKNRSASTTVVPIGTLSMKKPSPRPLESHNVSQEAEDLFHHTLSLFSISLSLLEISHDPKCLSPLSALSNQLSLFAALYVLEEKMEQERKKRYEALSQLITASIKLKNYHAAASLYQGLVRSEVSRLGEFIPDEKHQALFSPTHRWEAMRSVKSSHIPYSALISGQLQIYVEQKNQEALRDCIESIASQPKELFRKHQKPHTQRTALIELIEATTGSFSQEILEKKLIHLSHSHKAYPPDRPHSPY